MEKRVAGILSENIFQVIGINIKWAVKLLPRVLRKGKASPMTPRGQHYQIAGRSCQVISTTSASKESGRNHRETCAAW